MLENHPREQLCFIITQYGRTIIDDPRRCRGLLKDLAPNHKRETNLLFQALEEKIVAELAQKNTIIPLPLQLDRLAQRLHDNVGIQKDFAYWSVESWAIALNIIQQPLPKQQDLITDPYPEAVKYYEQKKYNEAFPLFKQVAEQGNANGQYHLGRMYKYGRGVEQDDKQAIFWFRKAAVQGQADGQFHLSVMYRDGCGVKQDDKQAIAWYRKAADQGHAAGQYHLGWMYKYGRGVEQDDKQAIFWYRKAANQGHADALKNLGEELAAEQIKSVTYKLGDVLPDGGVVFHVDVSGCQGLAVKATDEPRELIWNEAMTAASAYGSGWHLPTKDELDLLYQQVNVVGGFANNYYWSSTGVGSYSACFQHFGNGYQDDSNKDYPFRVRTVRAFQQPISNSPFAI